MKKVFFVYLHLAGLLNRSCMLSNIQDSEVTHICYASAIVQADGSLDLGSEKHVKSFKYDYDKRFYVKGRDLFSGGLRTEILTFKANKPVHFGLSIGSFVNSDIMRQTLNDRSKRRTLVNHVAQAVIDNNFDFIEVAWEFPRGPQDSDALIDFLRETKLAMRSDDRRRYVTVRLFYNAQFLQNLKLKEIFDEIAFANVVMSCMYCAIRPPAFHVSPYYAPKGKDCIDSAVKYLKSVHVPAQKIIVGFEAYALGFPQCTAIGSNFGGEPAMHGDLNDLIFSFLQLEDFKDKMQETFDADAVAASSVWKEKNMLFSHDSQKSVAEKIRLAFLEGCGGVFILQRYSDAKIKKYSLSDWINNAIVTYKNDSKMPKREVDETFLPKASK